jgi:hypothetical protein
MCRACQASGSFALNELSRISFSAQYGHSADKSQTFDGKNQWRCIERLASILVQASCVVRFSSSSVLQRRVYPPEAVFLAN